VSQQPSPEQQEVIGVEARAATVAADLPGNYFEIYKIAVEMADRISAAEAWLTASFLPSTPRFSACWGPR